MECRNTEYKEGLSPAQRLFGLPTCTRPLVFDPPVQDEIRNVDKKVRQLHELAMTRAPRNWSAGGRRCGESSASHDEVLGFHQKNRGGESMGSQLPCSLGDRVAVLVQLALQMSLHEDRVSGRAESSASQEKLLQDGKGRHVR